MADEQLPGEKCNHDWYLITRCYDRNGELYKEIFKCGKCKEEKSQYVDDENREVIDDD